MGIQTKNIKIPAFSAGFSNMVFSLPKEVREEVINRLPIEAKEVISQNLRARGKILDFMAEGAEIAGSTVQRDEAPTPRGENRFTKSITVTDPGQEPTTRDFLDAGEF